jgi:hypothetical protein
MYNLATNFISKRAYSALYDGFPSSLLSGYFNLSLFLTSNVRMTCKIKPEPPERFDISTNSLFTLRNY